MKPDVSFGNASAKSVLPRFANRGLIEARRSGARSQAPDLLPRFANRGLIEAKAVPGSLLASCNFPDSRIGASLKRLL